MSHARARVAGWIERRRSRRARLDYLVARGRHLSASAAKELGDAQWAAWEDAALDEHLGLPLPSPPRLTPADLDHRVTVAARTVDGAWQQLDVRSRRDLFDLLGPPPDHAALELDAL